MGKLMEKEIRCVLTRGRWQEEGKLTEEGQKVQTKVIRLKSTRGVIYNMIYEICSESKS